MEDVDTLEYTDLDDDHDLFMRHIAADDHELLMLDSYLLETFGKPEPENTI